MGNKHWNLNWLTTWSKYMGNVSKERIAELEAQNNQLTKFNTELEGLNKQQATEITDLKAELAAAKNTSTQSKSDSEAEITQLKEQVEDLKAKVKTDEDFKEAVNSAVVDKMADLGIEPVPQPTKAKAQTGDGNEPPASASNSADLATQMAAEILN